MGWVVSVTPRPRSSPGERTPSTHCSGGWVGLRASLDPEARRKILLPLSGIEARPVRSQTLYWMSYPGSSIADNITIYLLKKYCNSYLWNARYSFSILLFFRIWNTHFKNHTIWCLTNNSLKRAKLIHYLNLKAFKLRLCCHWFYFTGQADNTNETAALPMRHCQQYQSPKHDWGISLATLFPGLGKPT
jgi:hypothetical protein